MSFWKKLAIVLGIENNNSKEKEEIKKKEEKAKEKTAQHEAAHGII